MKRRSFINKLVQGTAIVGAGLSEKSLLSETSIPEPYHWVGDQYTLRQGKIGYFGALEEGRMVLDNRALVGLIV
jgi:hypothetical protein